MFEETDFEEGKSVHLKSAGVDVKVHMRRKAKSKKGHYTLKKALGEVGKSILWRVARKVSIKKWQEIVNDGEIYYRRSERCGYCTVVENKKKKYPMYLENRDCQSFCPASMICKSMRRCTPETILIKLRGLNR